MLVWCVNCPVTYSGSTFTLILVETPLCSFLYCNLIHVEYWTKISFENNKYSLSAEPHLQPLIYCPLINYWEELNQWTVRQNSWSTEDNLLKCHGRVSMTSWKLVTQKWGNNDTLKSLAAKSSGFKEYLLIIMYSRAYKHKNKSIQNNIFIEGY